MATNSISGVSSSQVAANNVNQPIPNNPFSQSLANAGSQTSIPYEIFHKILGYLPPLEAYKVQTLCRSEAALEVFKEQRLLFIEKTRLYSSELKEYQKILSVPFDRANPTLKSMSDIVQTPEISLNDLQDLTTAYSDITEDDLIAILKVSPNLKSIDLTDCKQFSGKVLKTIAKYCPLVNKINLSGCEGISDDDLHLFALTQHKFVSIQFPKHASLISIKEFAKNSPGLEEIKVNGNPISYSRLFSILAEFFPHLKNINVAEPVAEEKVAHRITDGNFVPFIRKFPQLSVLHLYSTYITDLSMNALAATCKSLKELWVNCAEITDQGIMAIAFACRDLESVSLISANKITGNSILALSGCSKLNTLIMPKASTLIKQEPIEHFINMHPDLESIVLPKSAGHRVYVALAERCKRLHSLGVSRFAKISLEDVQLLEKNCPKLDSSEIRKQLYAQ